MDQPTQSQPRQTAYIVKVVDILKGVFVKESGWNPSYIMIGDKQVARANIIGVIISIADAENTQTIVIDDGTGKITARSFEKKFTTVVGDAVMMVGRIRQYGSEIYIAPEIIKKIDPRWNAVWKKQALNNETAEPKTSVGQKTAEIKIDDHRKTRTESIIDKIKELDDGSGADYEAIMKFVSDEKILSNLILNGEIFEIKPGKLKVLD